ncbi:conserved hypothetical protein [Histoplasma capsulatum H143]|uniref:Uncharacterized protein n=1 Tax=Ajellomyces capsulatus (strain H143) TaxID=544712 RepID=C6HFB0_AJECH|nr:conserved hypothetical protein [Histoplasma capsulatum H143]
MGEALALAREISQLSPDAIVVTRAGLREAWEVGDVSKAVRNTSERYSRNLFEGQNLREVRVARFSIQGEFPPRLPGLKLTDGLELQGLLLSARRDSLTGSNQIYEQQQTKPCVRSPLTSPLTA